jgi:hypothetical protein
MPNDKQKIEQLLGELDSSPWALLTCVTHPLQVRCPPDWAAQPYVPTSRFLSERPYGREKSDTRKGWNMKHQKWRCQVKAHDLCPRPNPSNLSSSAGQSRLAWNDPSQKRLANECFAWKPKLIQCDWVCCFACEQEYSKQINKQCRLPCVHVIVLITCHPCPIWQTWFDIKSMNKVCAPTTIHGSFEWCPHHILSSD